MSRRVIDGASNASPAATTRTARTSSSAGASLSRNPDAPIRILLVEDSETQALELRLFLESQGFAVERCASAETALGVALLCPLIPNRLAGLGLTAFGAGLLTMYFGGDQYTEDDGIRPSDAGTSMAKDAWLVGAGLALAALPKK